ncbi:MAG: DegT/DnrJ/EryC1/StrS aminotransferase family protein [Burkholderiales bacterium]|nr:DegT/DnrJ/EryC1/StrS aminotransferase family protein [Burkholderiales bacterium]
MASGGNLDGLQRLALEGGAPVRKGPFAPWPEFAADEIEAVASVLRSGKVNYWTGEQSREFEREFARYVGAKYAVALSNGTAALELALYALGIGPGDEVVVPSKTFIATASCVVRFGATPVVADIDPDSQNLTAASVEKALTPRSKAIIAVHLAGWPCEMDEILALAKKRALFVVEDCAQSVGARYKDRVTGSIGDIGAYSFCQDKILTTGGEGGMLVTDSRALWEKAWSYKDHGKSYAAVYERDHPFGFRWLHESFGSNWRITEMQSAIGRLQLKKLPQWLSARRRNAALLDQGLSTIPGLRLVSPPPHSEHAYYKYYVFIRPEMLRTEWKMERILEALDAEGIPSSVGACSEIYLEKAFKDGGFGPKQPLPVASRLADSTLMFMLHPGLTEHDMQDTCTAVAKVMRAASA